MAMKRKPNPQMEKLKAFVRTNGSDYLRDPNITSVGIGYKTVKGKPTGEIAIQFKMAPTMLFDTGPLSGIEPNVLAIKIQPDEGISLRFDSKVPGQANQIRPVTMDFRYNASFGVESPEAYERLLLDAMLGDSTLFTRSDEVEASWSLITPIHEGWDAQRDGPLAAYEAGSWGPREADEFIGRIGARWRRL